MYTNIVCRITHYMTLDIQVLGEKCTLPVGEGGDSRDGRWAGKVKLNVAFIINKVNLKIKLREGIENEYKKRINKSNRRDIRRITN